MRNILLLTHYSKIDDLQPDIVKTSTYNKIEYIGMWSVDMAKELIEIKLEIW